LRRKLAEAGLPPVRFHDPRHTCATLLLENGVHERVTMEQLGHFQISLTLNTYSHVRPAMLSAAASALDRALGAHTLAPDSI
jgi:integrase